MNANRSGFDAIHLKQPQSCAMPETSRQFSLEWSPGALDQLFTALDMLIARMNPDFTFTAVNFSFAFADNQDSTFFPGKNLFDLYPNKENEIIFRRVVRSGEPYRAWATPFFCQSQSEIERSYWDWTLTPIKDDNGSVVELILGLFNASDRVAAETESQRHADRYKGVFEATNNGVAVFSAIGEGADFVFVDLNSACEMIEDIDRESVIGKPITEILPSVRKVGLFDALQQVWETGRPVDLAAFRYEDSRISGWRRHYVYKLPTSELVTLYRDETRQKEMELALRQTYDDLELKIANKTRTLTEANENLRTVLDSIQAGILIIDKGTHEIIDVNHHAAKMIGLPKKEIISRICSEFVCPVDRGQCPVSDETQSVDIADNVLLTSDDKEVPIIKSVVVGKILGKETIIESFVDITEQKEADRLEGVLEMAGAVCHEMNQPLMVISGYLEMLSMEINDDRTLMQRVEKINSQLQRLCAITDKLRNITRYKTREYLRDQIIDIDKSSHTG